MKNIQVKITIGNGLTIKPLCKFKSLDKATEYAQQLKRLIGLKLPVRVRAV